MLLPRRKWKDVKGYEGYYQVANIPYADKSQVRSVDHWITTKDERKYFIKGKLKKPRYDKYGYITVGLSKNGERKFISIHRLVALHFVDNPNSEIYNQVNHINENKQDNIWTNLEWTDAKGNANHGTRNERISESKKGNHDGFKRGKEHPRAKRIAMLDNDTGEIIKIFDCAAEAAEYLGKDRHQGGTPISECARGGRPRIYGYKWKYIQE